ncbi:hypothetical protein [Litoribacillus peritrichatus]|uniref:Lipoprotein n=1 Tax=Litoribacillus peritrichatus TaxID=718191 RepID=A0ABP7MRV1_9GAMM
MKTILSIICGFSLIISGCSTYKSVHSHDGHHHGASVGHHSKVSEESSNGGSANQLSTPHAHGSEGSLAGEPGKESQVDRVINVIADDTMRFTHEPLNIILITHNIQS